VTHTLQVLCFSLKWHDRLFDSKQIIWLLEVSVNSHTYFSAHGHRGDETLFDISFAALHTSFQDIFTQATLLTFEQKQKSLYVLLGDGEGLH